MIKALIDPSFLAPPAQGSCLPWLTSLRLWSKALREIDNQAVGPIMSLEAQAGLAVAGGRESIQAALERSGSPLGVSDVMRLIEGIRGRANTLEEDLDPTEVAFRSLSLEPDYVDSGKNELVEPFRQDLGHGAAFQQETTLRVAAITTSSAWAGTSPTVAVRGDVEAWEKFGAIEEPDDEVSVVSEVIDLWCDPKGADTTLNDCWGGLIDYPRLAVEVAYRALTPASDEREGTLSFQIGTNFVESMKAMGYAGKPGRIKAVFRAAAYIGCQRGGDLQSLEPHPYRKSAGPTGRAVERDDGAKLMRGSLGTGANANRLMWWDGPTPVILGVVGHNDDPRSLTR